MYKKEISFRDHEIPAKVDTITGEVLTIPRRINNIPEGKEKFDYDAAFTKSYERSWLFLVDNLKSHELKIAIKMANMTEYSTNSLAPLDDSVQLKELSEMFGVGINQVKQTFKRLMDVGVYASFRYGHYKRGIVTEWVFNPFVSFKGKLIDSDLKNLFIETPVARHFLSGCIR
jgi:hypothetical protein